MASEQVRVQYSPLSPEVPVGPIHIRWQSGSGTRITVEQASRLYHGLANALIAANKAELEQKES